jgi:hypothetical protein
MPLILVKADPVMSDEHRRPRPLNVRLREMGDHAKAVLVIGDFARCNHHHGCPADGVRLAASGGEPEG